MSASRPELSNVPKKPKFPMTVLEAIHRRRAVRAYRNTPVDEVTLRKLLDAAVQAPSAMNTQSWGFCVVQDRALLTRYSDRAKELLLAQLAASAKASRYKVMLSERSFDIFYDAGTLVVICAMNDGPWAEADCWLAAQNFMLAATAMGLGTCPIGFAKELLQATDVKAELGIPPEAIAIAPLIVGIPEFPMPPVPRAAPRILCWRT